MGRSNSPTSVLNIMNGNQRTGLSQDDANQKRRRHRGGHAWRVLTSWARQNPVLALLLFLFCFLCLFCMTLEHMGTFHTGNQPSHLQGRMRRAKALLQQLRVNRRQGEREEETEGEHNPNKGKKRGWFGGYISQDDPIHQTRYTSDVLHSLLDKLNQDIISNKDGGIRWVAPYLLLPPLTSDASGRQLQQQNDDQEMTRGQHRRDAVNPHQVHTKSEFFRVSRNVRGEMAWEEEYDTLTPNQLKPPVDYVTHEYAYPKITGELPNLEDGEGYPDYPPMKTLGQLMNDWPQDLDFPGAHQRPIPEGLYHFNYSNPEELEMARKFRDSELPFKLYGVPEISEATRKWTDDYVSENFDGRGMFRGGEIANLLGRRPDGSQKYTSPPPRASGMCQESANNFFAFFQPTLWDVKTMGLPPVRNNDWKFAHWAQHARYADAIALNASKPHFYWQSGVPREERMQPTSQWTFVSRDLPSFSSPTETFFVFNPESQKGIQCRFGERGVVAATHYDSGRNMIAMVTGAKRYILAPPKECPKVGIVPWKFNSVFRHSLLNFGHINYMDQPIATRREEKEIDDGEGHEHSHEHHKRAWSGEHISRVEREWLETAASSKAIETVLKAGEVLYVPSHWFHYIISLQKSAQCNVRSGIHDEGTPAFGGKIDVRTCGRLSPEEAA